MRQQKRPEHLIIERKLQQILKKYVTVLFTRNATRFDFVKETERFESYN